MAKNSKLINGNMGFSNMNKDLNLDVLRVFQFCEMGLKN